jgi:hypothetical protein
MHHCHAIGEDQHGVGASFGDACSETMVCPLRSEVTTYHMGLRCASQQIWAPVGSFGSSASLSVEGVAPTFVRHCPDSYQVTA